MANESQSTSISKIVNAFRSTHNLTPEKEVFLLFDGERLSPQTIIEETEISDMDHIDVYVR